MASVWSLDGRHLNLWGEAGGEHAAVLKNPDRFDSLHRKNDFLAEGVHTVFGIKGGDAELQGLYFQADLSTPAEAQHWLQERGLEALVITEATESSDTPTVERTQDGQ